MGRAHRCHPRGGHAEAARRSPACVAWQARPTQRASGLHTRGDAISAASLSGCALVSSVLTEAHETLTSARVAAAWEALRGVEDPEIPAVSIVELGLVRYVRGATPSGALQIGL